MTSSSLRALPRLAIAAVVPLLLANQLPAFDTVVPVDDRSWLQRLFVPGYPTAFDYIVLFLAVLCAVVFWFFFYRATLLVAVKAMQLPGAVKLRAGGVALVVFGVVLMFAPSLPPGWGMLAIVVGLVLGIRYGFSMLIGAILLIVSLLLMLWFSGVFG